MAQRGREAGGEEPADLVLSGGTVVDVLTGSLRRAEVAIASGRVVAVGEGLYGAAKALDCSGRFVALMSDQPIEAVVGGTSELQAATSALGSGVPHLFGVLSFLALPVIPALKITDRGLVEVTQFRHVPLAL